MAGSNLVVKLRLIAESKELQAGLDDGKRKLQEFGNEANKQGRTASSSLGSVSKMAAAAAVALAGMAAAGVAKATSDILALNRELNTLSQTLNISREALQTWQIAGQSVGIESEKMGDIFKDVNDKLGDFANTGGGEAVDLIKRLKLDINDLIAMSPDQALLKIAGAMEKATDMSTAEKTFLLESLANDASRLLPLLEDGAAKLDAIKERASTNLVIISDDQKAILDAANATMAEIGSSLDGLANQAGTAGAMLVNAFGDDFAGAIDQAAMIMQDLPAIASQVMDDVAASWAYGAQDMGGELAAVAEFGEIYFGYVGQYAMQTLDVTRMAFTYMPVYAKAGYDTARAYAESYMHSTAAMWADFQAASNFAFAALLQYAKGGFVGMASAGGAAIAFLIDKLATFAQSAAATFAALSDVPGFDAMADGAASVAGKLSGMADSARSAGATVAGAFDGAIANLQASGKAAQQSAAMHRQLALEARDTGQAAIEAAAGFIAQKEAQRDINAQIREENQELGGLANGLKETGKAAQKFHVNQDAVNKALKDGEGGAKAAKAAKSDLQKQTEQLAKAYADELQNLQLKNKELTQTGEAYYLSTLEAKNFTRAMQDEAGALHYSNTLLEARKKLAQEANAIKLNPLEQYRADLQDAGLSASDIAQLATEKQAVIQAKITAELEKQRKKAELTADEYAKWESRQEGVTEEFARQAVEYSKLTDEIEKQRKLAEDLHDSLVDAFVDAAESGFKSFDSLKDYFEDSFSSLVIKPTVQGVIGDLKAGNNPWAGLQQQFANTYAAMQTGGMTGAVTAGGSAGYVSGLLGGSEAQQIGATIGAAAGNILLPGLGGVIGGVIGDFAGSFFKDDDSARAYFTNGSPRDGYAFTDRGKTLYASSSFGTFGFQADGTHDLGEQGEAQLEAFVQKMAAIDDALAKFIPESEVQRIKTELQNYQKTGLDFDGLFKERLTIITSGLSDAMRGLIDYGQDADGIISQINELIVIQQQAVPALRGMGLQIGYTDDAALAAAAGLSAAAGGLQSLTSISAAYYDAVYSEAEQKEISIQNAYRAIDAFNEANGANINSLASLRAYVEGLDQTNPANQAATVTAMQLADELQLLADAGHIASTAATEVADSLDNIAERIDFIDKIQAGFDEINLTPVQRQIRDIQDEFDALTAEGRNLGASEAELLAVRQLADAKMQSLIADLTADIAAQYDDLMGRTTEAQIDAVRQQLQAEQDRIAAINEAANERYQAELDNYNNLIAIGSAYASLQLDALQKQLQSENDRIAAINASSDAAYQVELQRYQDGIKFEADFASASKAATQIKLDDLREQLQAEKDRIDEVNRAAQERYQAEIQQQQYIRDISGLYAQLNKTTTADRISAVNDQLQAELDRIDSVNAAAAEAYRTELDRYNKLTGLAKDIGKYLDSLKLSDLATSTPEQRLTEAKAQYADTLSRAQSGDTEAIADFSTAAREYLEAAQDYFANSNQYQGIFDAVVAAGESLQAKTGSVASPTEPMQDVTSQLATTLQQQLTVLQQQLDFERQQDIAQQIADKMQAISLSTGMDIESLAGQIGVDLSSLEQYIGDISKATTPVQPADIESLIIPQLETQIAAIEAQLAFDRQNDVAQSLADKIVEMSLSTGRDVDDLAASVGADFEWLGEYLDKSNVSNAPIKPAEVQSLVSAHLQEQITLLQEQLEHDRQTDVAQSLADKMQAISLSTGMDIDRLADSLGVDMEWLGTFIDDSIAASAPVKPAEIESLVTAHLEQQLSVLEAQLEFERKQNIASDIAGKLADLALATGDDVGVLASQLGIDLNSLGKYIGTNNILASRLDKQTAILTEQLEELEKANTTTASSSTSKPTQSASVVQIAVASANLAGMNESIWQQIAQAAKENTYDIGSDYITHDQYATIHKGEIIMTPAQSGSVRDNIVSAMSALAKLERLNADGKPVDAAILAELRGLRADNQRLNAELAALRSQVAQYSAAAERQRSAQIAELTTQRRDNERKTVMVGRV